MRRFMGKYASGNRKAAEQAKAERDFIKALPLAIRKVIKRRDLALMDVFIAQRRIYESLREQVVTMIKEHRNV